MSNERNRQPTPVEFDEARKLGAGPASADVRRAILQFNAGAYFVCHETLEDLWRAEPTALRRCYQGILHIAVGLLHLERGNDRGALSKLRSGIEYVRPFRPVCIGVDIDALVSETEHLLERIRTQQAAATGHGEKGPPILLMEAAG